MPTPDFVLALRERIGHDLLWMPGVSGVVLDDDGHLLLGRRADNGRWAVISGILDPGEQPAQGLVREVLEETGVDVVVEALVSVVASDVMTYPNGDVAQYLSLTFRARAVGGQARVNDDESTAVGWFATDDLPQDLSVEDQVRIADALAPLPGTRFVV